MVLDVVVLAVVNRSLLCWMLLAVVIAVLLGVVAVGPHPSVVLALVQAPALCAGLLLLRAGWLRLAGRSGELHWRGRPVLAGSLGWQVPLGVLVLWTVVRETGWFDANLSWSQSEHRTSWNSSAWRELPSDALPSEGRLVVEAVGGTFGAAFREGLAEHWLVGTTRVTGRVTTTYLPPVWCLPLYKSEAVEAVVRCELRLEPQDGPVRAATIEWQFTGRTTVYGLASRRYFHTHLGRLLGRSVGKAVRDHVAKASKD